MPCQEKLLVVDELVVITLQSNIPNLLPSCLYSLPDVDLKFCIGVSRPGILKGWENVELISLPCSLRHGIRPKHLVCWNALKCVHMLCIHISPILAHYPDVVIVVDCFLQLHGTILGLPFSHGTHAFHLWVGGLLGRHSMFWLHKLKAYCLLLTIFCFHCQSFYCLLPTPAIACWFISTLPF